MIRITSIITLLSLAFVLSVLSTSCAKDPCETLDCKNGGICVDGDCDCPEGFLGKECDIVFDPCDGFDCVNGTCINSASGAYCDCDLGYEGTTCETGWYEKFLGNFDASESCGAGGSAYISNVIRGPKFNEIIFDGFHNFPGTKILGVVIESQVFEIPFQPMSFGHVTGFGSIDDNHNEITINYRIIDVSMSPPDTLFCLTNMERK